MTRKTAPQNGGPVAPAAPAKPDGCVWEGNDDLVPLLMPLTGLSEDPANLNLHDERSVAEIAGSYRRFGQQKPLVADAAGVVRAGNGQLAAARRLGWTHVAVSRSGLERVELVLYAITDNRTPEFAERNLGALASVLRAHVDSGGDLSGTGYTEEEAWAVMEAAGVGESPAADDPSPAPGAPEEFPEYDETIATDYLCPKCGYRWSGKATAPSHAADAGDDPDDL